MEQIISKEELERMKEINEMVIKTGFSIVQDPQLAKFKKSPRRRFFDRIKKGRNQIIISNLKL